MAQVLWFQESVTWFRHLGPARQGPLHWEAVCVKVHGLRNTTPSGSEPRRQTRGTRAWDVGRVPAFPRRPRVRGLCYLSLSPGLLSPRLWEGVRGDILCQQEGWAGA